MRLRRLIGGLALAAATAGPVLAQDVKIGFITKFPVPFFATMENAAKEYRLLDSCQLRAWIAS